MCVETHPGFFAAALEHPWIPAPSPFHPFASAGNERYLALLHGRIDNLAELSGRARSDPTLWVLTQWLSGHVESLTALVGSFVVMIADLEKPELHLLRDPLGDRSVFYRAAADGWWVATEEPALWPDSGAALELDPKRITEFFAIEDPAPGSTCFAGIAELPPAHRVALAPGRAPRLARYWSFRYRSAVRKLGLDEAAEELTRLLEQAVRVRIDPSGPTAIAVSGGMDSPAVAAVVPEGAAVRLYTYHTPSFPDCDETGFARALAAGTGAPLTAVDCDRHWPLSARFFDPPWLTHEPSVDAYRAMRFELARAATEDGCRVMLTGDFGDNLYGAHPYWLKDLFTTGHWLGALEHLGRRLVRHGLLGLRTDPPLRRIMPLVGITRGRRRARPWLTERANELLGRGAREHAYLGPIREIDRVEGCLNNFTARMAHLGYLQGLRWGVEMRTPFRDRRLLEFALSLPAHYLYDPDRGLSKALMRHALVDRLPEEIVQRRGKTSLEAIFRHGVLGAGRQRLEDLLAGDRHWRRFVDADWLTHRLLSGNWNDLSLFVLWSCAAFSLGCRQLDCGINVDSQAGIG